MNLESQDLQMFRKLLVSDELLERAQIRRVTSDEAKLDFGIDLGGDSGIAFPYMSPPNGVPSRRVTARIRRDNPPRDGNGKPEGKYRSPYPPDTRHLYFAPCDPDWIKSELPQSPVVLVEAEKSALAILAWCERHDRRMLPVAMGGCWSWRGRIGKAVDENGARVDEKGPLPDLQVCAGRRVYVLYDSNCSKNNKVYVAREKLIEELLKLKSEVRVVDLPDIKDVNGPDDFLEKQGDVAFFELLETATSRSNTSSHHIVVWDSPEFLKQKFPPREPLAVFKDSDTPLFTRQSINQIFGYRGTGKTLLSMSLAGEFSVGGEILNWKMTRAANVLYVDGELPNPQIQERMAILHPPDARIKLISLDSQFPNSIPSLATEQGQQWLEPTLVGVDVLFLDSIATLAPFATNDEERWLPFNAWLQRLRSRGLCIILIQQAGKAGLQRGHSRGDDPLDVQIKLETDDDEESEHCKCNLYWEKFRGNRKGGCVRSLSIECTNGKWSYSILQEDKLKILDEYLCVHRSASSRKISQDCPELGSHTAVQALLKKLKGSVK